MLLPGEIASYIRIVFWDLQRLWISEPLISIRLPAKRAAAVVYLLFFRGNFDIHFCNIFQIPIFSE